MNKRLSQRYKSNLSRSVQIDDDDGHIYKNEQKVVVSNPKRLKVKQDRVAIAKLNQAVIKEMNLKMPQNQKRSSGFINESLNSSTIKSSSTRRSTRVSFVFPNNTNVCDIYQRVV